MKSFGRIIRGLALTAILALFAFAAHAQTVNVPGLGSDVTVYTDANGIPTIVGETETDVIFVQGYLHARDRFFQMDFLRRVSSGTLAELLGPGALASDIQLRTLGLRRAALATWVELDPDEKTWVKAYADGVNAFLADNPLPPAYGPLELTSAERWTPVDSLVIGKLLAFQLSFDSGVVDNTIDLATYQGVGEVVGFDGVALFFEDIFRFQPNDDRVSIPGFLESIGVLPVGADEPDAAPQAQGPVKPAAAAPRFGNLPGVNENVVESLRGFVDQLREVPLIGPSLADPENRAGSNWWVVSGDYTASGYPMLANDPHLGLDMPPIFTNENLVIRDEDVAVSGVSFPGTPLVVLGCNPRICWGATVNRNDVTDYFQEELRVNNFGLPTHTVYQGRPEPILPVFQSYFVNNIGDGEPDSVTRANVPFDGGAITFLVPRRSNGPIVALPDATTGISVQYTGWGPTFELSTFRAWSRARNLDEFRSALSDFTFGGQNFAYADVDGNIAYFTSGTAPLREDLQNLTVDGGVPPFLLRDGTGQFAHGWLPTDQPVTRGLPFAALPPEEMPHVINPPWGYIANANNDPVGVTLDNSPLSQLRPGGNGIYYLGPSYASLRMGRLDRSLQDLIASGEPVTLDDMKALQANNQPLDAEIIVPFVLEAFENAVAEEAWPGLAQFAADPRIQEAVGRLAAWDFSTPTGLAEGFDPGEDPFAPTEPSQEEIAHSVAATIYATFRGQAIRNTVDATLSAIGLGDNLPNARAAYRAFQNLLVSFPERQGVGASGVPFFNVEGAPDMASARDTLLLASLQGALDLLASDEFAPAFNNSTNQQDYRWGRLHRIVFSHPLGADPFNVPNGAGFSDLEDGFPVGESPDAEDGGQPVVLPGIARPGGFEVLDASAHSVRASSVNGFMFSAGPARRTVAEMGPDRARVEEIVPGGRSGIFLSPFYANQLRLWLVNDYLPVSIGEEDAQATAAGVTTFTTP